VLFLLDLVEGLRMDMGVLDGRGALGEFMFDVSNL
jgi:hypothetical protein